jgi:hypothetical protein
LDRIEVIDALVCVHFCSASTPRKRHTDNQETVDELYAHTPTIIIACGNAPARHLFPNRIIEQHRAAKDGCWRGSLLCSPKLNWSHSVVPCQHPAYIVRSRTPLDHTSLPGSKRIGITWPENGKSWSRLYAQCETPVLCIVIWHVGT